jgi:cytochrome c oxidase assembly protein subunit 11
MSNNAAHIPPSAPRRGKGARRTKLTAYALVGLVGGMGVLVATSQPLYQAFCQITGFGGTTQVADEAKLAALIIPVEDDPAEAAPYVTVRFDANTNTKLPWRFRPVQKEMRVRIGEQMLAHFEATNISDRTIVGTATFNVTPYKTASYFNKIDCFCFTEQVLRPGQTAQMPVIFFVDPEILKDTNTRHESTITLSYTFFADQDQSAAKEEAAARGANNNPANGAGIKG